MGWGTRSLAAVRPRDPISTSRPPGRELRGDAAQRGLRAGGRSAARSPSPRRPAAAPSSDRVTSARIAVTGRSCGERAGPRLSSTPQRAGVGIHRVDATLSCRTSVARARVKVPVPAPRSAHVSPQAAGIAARSSASASRVRHGAEDRARIFGRPARRRSTIVISRPRCFRRRASCRHQLRQPLGLFAEPLRRGFWRCCRRSTTS